MKFRYLKFKGKVKQVREVEINSLIDYLNLNNKTEEQKNGRTKN